MGGLNGFSLEHAQVDSQSAAASSAASCSSWPHPHDSIALSSCPGDPMLACGPRQVLANHSVGHPADQGLRGSERSQAPTANISDNQADRLHVSTAVVRGERLTKKTPARETAYAAIRPVGTKLEQTSRKREIQETIKANNNAQKAARSQALRVMQNNIVLVNEKVDGKRVDSHDYSWDYADGIHQSHNIKPIKNDPHAFYCNRYGAWNTGGPLKCLRGKCAGFVSKQRKFQHRLLELGVVPLKAVKTLCFGLKRTCRRN